MNKTTAQKTKKFKAIASLSLVMLHGGLLFLSSMVNKINKLR